MKFHVPSAAARGSLLTYTLEKGSFTDGGTTLSFAQPAQNVGVTAAYELTADIMTVGGNGKLYVKTADGKPPAACRSSPSWMARMTCFSARRTPLVCS